jgi:5-methylcytosine-specific restriction endonuclease McrA
VKDSKAHPWLKIDPVSTAWLDGVSFDAFSLWCALQLYQARTGGTALVPRAKLHAATARRLTLKRIAAAVAELLDEGQLIDHGDAVELVVWEQPPVEVWQDDVLRWRWQRNGRLKRMSELREFVKTRDRSLCRYCSVRVNWADKKGPTGATYDHVDPDIDNTRDNVVVACRRCNGRKKDRTPAQAGMPLLKPGETAPQEAASAATGPVPDPPAGGDRDPARAPDDPDPTQIRSRSGTRSARARPRDRTDPDSIQIAPSPPAGPHPARPDDRSVPRLRQTGGAIRVRPEDPAHPDHEVQFDDVPLMEGVL